MSQTSQWEPPPSAGSAPPEPGGQAPPPEPPPPKRRRKERKEKAPRARRVPVPAAARGDGPASLFDMTASGPGKEELDRMAAAELEAAIAPSLELLRMSVPGASTPDEAGRQIEGQLGPPLRDRDADLPDHPIYTGDALVYYQLRRHYGRPHGGGSFQRSWYPGGGGGGGGATGALPPMLGS